MLRIGFLGCGDVATRRAHAIRALNERGDAVFEFVATCDLVPAKSAQFADRFGGKPYSSLGRMLGDAELDALFVATPPGARGPAENAALASGIALWIEPPIAATIRTANAIALQIKKSGVPVMVCAPHRYCPEIERVKRTLSLKSAPRFSRWSADVNAGLPRATWRSETKNGTVWLDGAWPTLDLLRFLGVATSSVSAKSNPESGVASLELRGGALASLGISRFGTAREVLHAQSDNDHLRVDDWSTAPRIELSHNRETTVWQGEEAIIRQLLAFARFLTEGKRTENRSPITDALLTLKLGLELGKNK
ncbi:Gfo/Idh/MocA family oxidoreductase [bacterium]|nr:MAG: Gfo/Idh/MocA family oxidoreductase [bacterium]